MHLRVLVYNVRGFRAGVEAVAGVVAPLGPDLLLVQECGARRSLRGFARACGLEAVSGPLSPWRRRIRNAVLVRPPFRVVEHRLHAFHGSRRFYPRGAVVAQIGRAGRRFDALSAHLGLASGERLRHARLLTDVVAGFEGSVVLGVDLNEPPEAPAARWIGERLWDAWTAVGDGEGATFPSEEPTARIDYCFLSEGIAVRDAKVLDGPEVARASDHRPLLADLALPDGP